MVRWNEVISRKMISALLVVSMLIAEVEMLLDIFKEIHYNKGQ